MSEQNTCKNVTFVYDGEIVATASVAVGERPTAPEISAKKEGYRLMWLGINQAVQEDVTLNAYEVLGNPKELLEALSFPLLGFDTARTDNVGSVFASAFYLIYLASEVRNNPNHEIFRARAVESLKNMVNPEKNCAPYFDLSCNWPYAPVTAAITLCHETPEIWNGLTAYEQEVYDFIMECFAYVQGMGTNDPNYYCTGPGLYGNFGKTWNPNYRLANTPPVVFAGRYFGGAEKLDKMLLSFDYDATVARLEKYGFQRALARWTRPAAVVDGVATRSQKDFMEDGGEAFINTTDARLNYYPGISGGTGVGVRAKYTWKGFTVDQYHEILRDLFLHNYSGGPCISTYGEYPDGSPKAYIADHTTTPVEGREGMMREMASRDGGDGVHGSDIRSSTTYCSHDFILVISLLMALKEMGMYRLEEECNRDVYELAWVGNTDFIYKCVHGYMSYSLGHEKGVAYENPHGGYFLAKTWWMENYAEDPCEK